MSDVKEYIAIKDSVFPDFICDSLIKVSENNFQFEKSHVVGFGEPVVNEKIRKVQEVQLRPDAKSRTTTHWHNILQSMLFKLVREYEHSFGNWAKSKEINEIGILRYESTGHYDYHVDHNASVPRTLSCILFLNDDYEGGKLNFLDIRSQQVTTIKPKKGRLIIWPSSYMYPHKVEEVTKGIRYTVVAWTI